MDISLLSITPHSETVIESAGRTCYKSKMGSPEIIQKWIKSGHESMLEHASATFLITGVSRALSHQLVRHRIASFSQQSQRYVKEDQFEYVTPDSIKAAEDKQIGIIVNGFFEAISLSEAYDKFMRDTQSFYNALIQQGIKPEDARFILPNACCTELVMTMNMREFRHFFELRCDKHAQWEVRKLATMILSELFRECPNVFHDLAIKFLSGDHK